MGFFSDLVNADTVKTVANSYFSSQGLGIQLPTKGMTPNAAPSRETVIQIMNPGAAATGYPAQPVTTAQGVQTGGLPWYRTTIGMVALGVAGVAVLGALFLASRK